ncbi:bifunctional Gfo/Idh/MocA family oxidoreductase/class I SAM-dependent methyltransferase [Streptomyces sulphureus]|uniref:bifunctional Gfo/Idh/MocA family oxidoreductase/class I SAM-dependent methyltransferase n=1 Tax=Streptomyces sulphureus TaxID=47758 RepID=UPI000381E26D|nr:bifunctional Gfo/Idh/MocA family oxidoreductase/class I SAM-dependent methyltransferase [Streptomyces sulphureus]
MNDGKLKTLVCGSTFGQFYLAALASRPDRFETVGLLARGSERSRRCAERYGVPLYAHPKDLPDDIDLACVVVRSGVMGGTGTSLALDLLGRGIHVLQEQPVHHDDLAACLREARRNHVHYRLGDLYAQLPEVRRFVSALRRRLDGQRPVYVDAACASQVAFPLLHILGDALGAVRPWQVTAAAETEGAPFSVLTGVIGGVPLTLRVQNQIDPEDPDNHLHLLHRITVGTHSGSLTLHDPHGPVLWSPRLHISDSVKSDFDFDAPDSRHLGEATTVSLSPQTAPPYREALGAQWPAAIARDLSALRAQVAGETGEKRPDQYHLALTRMWRDLTGELGYPSLLTPRQPPVPETGPAGREGEPAPPETETAELVRRAAAEADREVGPVDPRQVRDFVEQLDDAVLASMLRALQRPGLLDDPARSHSLTDILATARVAPRHHALVGHWLRTLVERGRLTATDAGYAGAPTVGTAHEQRLWREANRTWQKGLGTEEFVGYLRRNAQRLPELLTGEQQAALLLFPEGRTELADSVYRETVTARYLNTAVASLVRGLAASRTPQDPLRVVEVGAGTGATTEAVIAALGPAAPVDYLFTDVSRFFLTARERFGAVPWLRQQLFDIDREPAEQNLTAGSADVVLAAGVLNNARDTDTTVRSLARLLAPGGHLLVTEPVREHLEILTSQAFMMTPPEDARAASGTSFLTENQWRDVFTGAGLGPVVAAPADDHPLAPLGQRLFAAPALRTRSDK